MKIMTEHILEQVIPAHDCVTELFKFDGCLQVEQNSRNAGTIPRLCPTGYRHTDEASQNN